MVLSIRETVIIIFFFALQAKISVLSPCNESWISLYTELKNLIVNVNIQYYRIVIDVGDSYRQYSLM